MKKFAVVLLTVFAVLMVAIPLFAQDEAKPAATGTGINVRSGPGTEFSLRGGLIRGSLTITGRNEFDTSRVCTGIVDRDLDMWLRVDFNGVEGWVALCAVDINSDLASVPVVTASMPILIAEIDYANNPVAQKLGDEPETFVYGVTRARVNMRDGGGLGSTVITELRGGELVYVTGMNGDASWVQVEVGENTGWVARYLLSLPAKWEETFAPKES